jgi:hypothetical protein
MFPTLTTFSAAAGAGNREKAATSATIEKNTVNFSINLMSIFIDGSSFCSLWFIYFKA